MSATEVMPQPQPEGEKGHPRCPTQPAPVCSPLLGVETILDSGAHTPGLVALSSLPGHFSCILLQQASSELKFCGGGLAVGGKKTPVCSAEEAVSPFLFCTWLYTPLTALKTFIFKAYH